MYIIKVILKLSTHKDSYMNYIYKYHNSFGIKISRIKENRLYVKIIRCHFVAMVTFNHLPKSTLKISHRFAQFESRL